jgi:adenylate kinase
MSMGTSCGEKVKEIVNFGKLVPDQIITQIIKERVPTLLKENKVVVLDGYPRTVGQVQELDALCKMDLPQEKIRAIYLFVDFSVLEERLLCRVMCEACGTVGALKEDGIFACSFCGGKKFVRRQDDTRETVRVRLEEYEKVTAPVLQIYEQRGEVRKIDGSADAKTVAAQVEEAVAGF